MLKETEVIHQFVKREMLCGSRVTCRPAPTNTDQDVIVLVADILATASRERRPGSAMKEYAAMSSGLASSGWCVGGSGEGDDDFESWTKGDINLILTADNDFYEKFVTATTVCQNLNIMEKHKRQMVFQSILYGNRPYSPEPNGLPGVPF